MQKIWEESFKVKFNEVDYANRIKAGTLFNYMQEAAANHATDLKLNYIQNFSEKDLIWILSRAKIKVIGTAGWKDELNVKTWPKCIDGLFAVRDFAITKGKDEIGCVATTAWLILDKNTMRPKKTADVLPENMPLSQNEQGIDEHLGKLKIECDLEEVHQVTAVFSDLDVNKHVNNARYIDWVMDSVSMDWLENHRLDTLTIDLLSETKPGDRVTISKGVSADNQDVHFFQGVNQRTQKKAFGASVEWLAL